MQCSSGESKSVGYQTDVDYKEGTIWIDDENVRAWTKEAFVGVNGTLLMRVDTIKYEITFINSANPKKEFKFPFEKKHWKDQEIYAYVSMGYKGDCISVLSVVG